MQRFWEKVKKTDTCWLWIAGKRNKNGYGCIKIKGKVVDAHRVSWELHFGKIPKGKIVCHHCDVKACVNPKHLFVGSYLDNLLDAYKKGINKPPAKKLWFKKGHIPKNRKLTPQKANNIRKKFSSGKAGVMVLSREYGVDEKAIRMILSGKTYK